MSDQEQFKGLAGCESPQSDIKHVCRVAGLAGLEARRSPIDAAIIPQSILEWASAAQTGQIRFAQHAPAVYYYRKSDKTSARQLVASRSLSSGEERDRNAENAGYRLLPATYEPATSDTDTPASRVKQKALTPRQVAVLGQLNAHVKYQLLHSHVMPSGDSPTGFRLYFNAGCIIDRLGYARGGDAYAALEEDLAALARFIVKHEKRHADEWKTIEASPLLSLLDTGRCRVSGGQRTDSNNRRSELWCIEFGYAMKTLLDTRPSDLSVIASGVWAAAGRSRVEQWLALWLSGHGYDQNEMRYHRVDTLCRRMSLLPQEIQEALHGSGMKLSIQCTGGVLEDAPSPAFARPANVAPAGSLPRGDALSSARRGWRQIKQAMARLERHNAVQASEWQHRRDAPDVRPSQAGRALSGHDLVRFKRWSGAVEGVLPKARRWAKNQLGGLLDSLNRNVTSLRKLANSNSERAAVWAEQQYESYRERLHWLSHDDRPPSVGALRFTLAGIKRHVALFALVSSASPTLRFTPTRCQRLLLT